MNLGTKQELFARQLPRLLDYIHSLGYGIRLGDSYRDERIHGAFGTKKGYGHKNSCHKLKLAQDINLMKGGKFLSKTSDHLAIGMWWEEQHPDNRWGGRFNDGNHYSMTHWGAM